MLVDKNGNISIITQEKASIVELYERLNKLYETIANDNIIIVLNSLEAISEITISEFLQISNTHRTAKHSFVLVSDKVDIDAIPEALMVVPTLQEAYDVIEMEEMERDLGF